MNGEEQDPTPRAEPTDKELTEWTAVLLVEVDSTLSSDRWAILDTGSNHSIHRLYDAAALRHCAALLAEIDAAGRSGFELATRVLARTHVEALLFALYIHFGGFEAVKRIARDTLASLETTQNDLVAFDEWLKSERRTRTKARKKVRSNNESNLAWNAEHPGEPQRPIIDEPYVPQLSPTGVDLSDAIADFGDLEAEDLPVRRVVDALTKWGPQFGFARESFTPMYHIYRVLSGVSVHTSLNILDAYFLPGGFVRTGRLLSGPSMLMDARVTSLYGTAFLAGWVLGDAGSDASVSRFLRNRLEPDPSGGRGWAPGAG